MSLPSRNRCEKKTDLSLPGHARMAEELFVDIGKVTLAVGGRAEGEHGLPSTLSVAWG